MEFPGVLVTSFESVLKALQLRSKANDMPLAELLVPPTEPMTLQQTGLPAYTRKAGFKFNLKAIHGGDAVMWDPSTPFDYLQLRQRSTLDEAQGYAVINALTNQLALIQGPPGFAILPMMAGRYSIKLG